jgi:hypothetical protein
VLLSARRDLAGRPAVLQSSAARGYHPRRGHHRPGPGLPAGPG